ncbi:DUF4411 family protein [Thermodesulfobacteriota bacterium]
MLYLLDANVLIDANRDYYPLGRIPEFWDWLVYMGTNKRATIPLEQYEEIVSGNDELAKWAKNGHVKTALLFSESVNEQLVAKVTEEGYAPDLNDVEIEKIGRDPFLIAYALGDNASRCVVTTEGSKPKRTRANRHVPDVCEHFGVKCCHTFTFVQDSDFKTDWKSTPSN